MDTDEFPGTGQGYSKSYRAWRIIGIIAMAVAVLGFGFWVYFRIVESKMVAADSVRISALEKEVKELKAAAKPVADTRPAPVVEATAQIPPATVPTAKVEPLPSSNELYFNNDGGEWAVILHTLFDDDQIASEKEETAAAFEACSKETTYVLTPCVSVIKDQKMGSGYKIAKASLATVERGLDARWALRLADCFNRHMTPVEGKENRADAVKLRNFEPECLPAK